ncbi:MAG: Hsp70 family protein [Bacteroidota bacterium]
MGMINFGIDLGTTNSAIGKFEKGKVEIFKNPVSLKETLPSVVAFRKGRLLVGDKAREFLKRDPLNVVGSFKRKMGTSETYFIESEQKEFTPVNLSAMVLRELKNFVHSGENPEGMVITIPASFDTIQSNATKKAGIEAGFKQVVLLQEPIAASLAYANKDEADNFGDGKWLVYDLGGGTFDVALVSIFEGEMKVLDHEGNNFLGGTDFDLKIIEELVIPHLESEGKFTDLERELKSASGRYNKLFHLLLHKAEEAKIELSTNESTELEFEITDEEGNEHDIYFTITRKDFESILEPFIKATVKQISNLLVNNQLNARDLKFVLMVGGSTYIPFVRKTIGEELDIEVNCNIDPTTAIAKGAAFFAGTKLLVITDKAKVDPAFDAERVLDIKTGYQKATQDLEEYFTALIQGDWLGYHYRITRQDGGYDSGLKPLDKQISELLPLVKDSYNHFDLLVFDESSNPVETNVPIIGIAQGRYSVAGQPLPHDICLEIDDLEEQTTSLEVVFTKNDVLPTKRTLIKELTKTIKKGAEETITINIVEGPGYALPSANQVIGFISISGKELTRDIIKGSDIEITLEMSESRDMKINVYLTLTDQEFEDIFTPSERTVNITRLNEELLVLLEKLNLEIREAEVNEQYVTAKLLNDIKKELRSLMVKSNKIKEDDVTDEKFQIEDQKRKIAQEVDNLTADKRINSVKMEYFKVKKDMLAIFDQFDVLDHEKSALDRILDQERSFLSSNSLGKIKEMTDKMYDLRARIRWRDPSYVAFLFYWFASQQSVMTNKTRAQQLIDEGEKAIEEKKHDKLRVIVNELFGLLPKEAQKRSDFQGGTGIS